MSYGQFLLLFLLVPLVAVLAAGRRRLDRRLAFILGAISLVAILYTGPWDNAIIANGVWSYGRTQVVGILLGHVPLEEYVFYVLQTCLVGCVAALLLRRED